MDALHPYIDVIAPQEIAAHEALPLGLPALGEAGDGRRRQPRLLAEELLQSRNEVTAGETMEIQLKRQDLCYLRRAAHVGWQDHALEPLSVAILIEDGGR
jgi:hypothetical protein